MNESSEAAEGARIATYRTMEIAVALFFLVASAVVIADSLRLGMSWRANVGPAPGYFPFYIACLMALASIGNLIRALPRTAASGATMVNSAGLARMAAIFVPAVVFVFATAYVGIYVAAAIYIAGFMIIGGKFEWWRSAAVGVSFAIVAFMMFEVWFLVPLPKGPLEDALGF